MLKALVEASGSDLAVTVAAPGTPVTAGTAFTATVQVTNAGRREGAGRS